MRVRKTAAVLGMACVAAVSTGGTAAGATKTVTMGPPPSAIGELERLKVEVNAFFPRTSTVRVGDSVRFVPMGFHTADFPARDRGPLANIIPTGKKAEGVKDAAGTPFWFDGLDLVALNPALLRPLFGKTRTYTGAARVNSGLPIGRGKPKPFTVKFTKAGSYEYFCDLHPGMKGRVRVRSRRRDVTSARADRLRVAAQAAQAVRDGRAARRQRAPTSTVLVGAAGPRGVEHMAFHPAKTTVPVGTTLRFQMTAGSFEAHTATTGPRSYLRELAESIESPAFDPRLSYSSERPGTPAASLTPRLHGNGFWNSGVLDRTTGSPPPASAAVRFDEAGTYNFVCLIHPFMRAAVTAK